MNIQDDMYEYYHSLLRYSYVKDYHNYVSDDNNHKLVNQLADEIIKRGGTQRIAAEHINY